MGHTFICMEGWYSLRRAFMLDAFRALATLCEQFFFLQTRYQSLRTTPCLFLQYATQFHAVDFNLFLGGWRLVIPVSLFSTISLSRVHARERDVVTAAESERQSRRKGDAHAQVKFSIWLHLVPPQILVISTWYENHKFSWHVIQQQP